MEEEPAGERGWEEEGAEEEEEDCADGFELVGGSGRCYLTRTVFKTPQGELKFVRCLKVGDQILGAAGRRLEVAYAHIHPRQMCKLVTLRTAQAELTVTLDHRVVVPGGDGAERLAGELMVGDAVIVGARGQRLTRVMLYEEAAELVEVRFNPDDPVETRMASPHGIMTKGQRMPIAPLAFGRLGPHRWDEAPAPRPHRRARSAEP